MRRMRVKSGSEAAGFGAQRSPERPPCQPVLLRWRLCALHCLSPIHPPTHSLPTRPLPLTGYAMGTRRSRLHTALDRLTPGRRRRSGAAGSTVGSGPLSPAGMGLQGGSQGRPASVVVGPVSSGKLEGGDLDDGAEAPLAVPLDMSAGSATAANGNAKHAPLHGQLSADGRLLQLRGSAAEADQLPPSPFDTSASTPVLLPSPFEVPATSGATATAAGASQQVLPRGSAAASAAASGARRPTAQLPGNGRLMLYQRSMLRLRSSVAGALRGQNDAAGDSSAAAQRHGQRLAALEEGRSVQEDGAEAARDGDAAIPPAEPEQALEPAGGSSPGNANGNANGKSGGRTKGSFSWDDKAVRVTSRCVCCAVLRCGMVCCAVLQ